MFIPHCINYNMDQHQPAVVKSNHAVERQTADNFYGWETEIKPPGPQLKVHYFNNDSVFTMINFSNFKE